MNRKLIVQDLAVDRGGMLVLSGVSFVLSDGEALMLTGPNGAGKTTLIRTIAGFLSPTAGAIRFEGGHPEATLAEQCHYVGHLNAVKAELTVGENAAFWARYLGTSAGPVPGALARFGLATLADMPAAFLSAGQARRLGLARLLLAARSLWLLDEPTVALDAAGQAVLTEIIAEHLRSGGLLIAAQHAPLGITAAKELRLGRRSPFATMAG